MFIIPIFQNASSKFIQQVTLNNEVFKIRFFWNTRDESWYMSILDIDDVVRLVVGTMHCQNKIISLSYQPVLASKAFV